MIDSLLAVGFGLPYGSVDLEVMTPHHVAAGGRLRTRVAQLLRPTPVEQIGSSSVPELLAKPIVDLAAGLGGPHELNGVSDLLQGDGWIYRGDAGNEGGHVFVLEARHEHRVAHLHAVPHDGEQWRNYIRLRDLLRTDADARARYGEVKQALREQYRDDHRAYTTAKNDVVAALLATTD